MAVVATRTWTVSANNAFSSAVDQQVQFREAVFNLKATFVNAGWTVVRSSNATVIDGSDNWTTDADVVLGTSGNGSWIVFRSPVGWIPNSEQIELLLFVNDTGANPQTAPIQICPQGYRNGSTTALPTANGSQTTVLTLGDDVIPWSAIPANNGRWTSWYTSRGDVMFGVKEETIDFFRFFTLITGNVDADGGGDGDQRWALFASTSTVNIFGGSGAHLSSGRWRGTIPSGDSFPTTEPATVSTNINSWVLGLDIDGATLDTKMTLWIDSAVDGRYLGRWVDVFAAPVNLPFGTLDTSEGAQDPRRVGLGEVWVYMPAAALPFV